ncbi:MAG: GNAT family N-acetyltransferase [Limnothrix sp.]
MSINVIRADYQNQQHAQDIVFLLNNYAADPAGGGKGLTEFVKQNLVSELAQLPYAFSLLAYIDENPAGLVNCFQLFSTFKCKPVVNIHDAVVCSQYRRQGLSQRLLAEVETIARAKGACKITLEVLEKNAPARKAYEKFGFAGYELDPEFGNAIFLEKNLS